MEQAWRKARGAVAHRIVLDPGDRRGLGNAAKGPFFEVSLILLSTSRLGSESGPLKRNGNPATTMFDVARTYRYDDTPEARQALHPGALGKALFHDLLASGQIEFARTGTLPPPGGQPVGQGFPMPDVQLVMAHAEGATAPADAKACLLISTGAISLSSVSADPMADKFWVEVDRQLMVALQRSLNLDGYRSFYVFTEIAQRNAQPSLLSVGQKNSKCASLITIAHQVGEDEQGRFFGFNVTVTHFVTPFSAPAGDPPQVVFDYTRLYRFPLSQELMDSSPSEFIREFAGDGPGDTRDDRLRPRRHAAHPGRTHRPPCRPARSRSAQRSCTAATTCS